MKLLFTLSFTLMCVCFATAQSPQSTDTIILNMLKHGGEWDTSAYEFSRDVQRYFNRNLRGIWNGREVVQGYATVSFVVDREGKVALPQCLAMTNNDVGKEALRVAKRLSNTGMKPLSKNGQPVVAKVTISICFTDEETHEAKKEEIKSKACIVVISYPRVHIP